MPYSFEMRRPGGPGVLSRVERPIAEAAARDLLIRNHASAVNFVDTLIRRGEMPPGMMPVLPHVPGVEGAGIVEAVGKGVEGFALGDRVAWMGRSARADMARIPLSPRNTSRACRTTWISSRPPLCP